MGLTNVFARNELIEFVVSEIFLCLLLALFNVRLFVKKLFWFCFKILNTPELRSENQWFKQSLTVAISARIALPDTNFDHQKLFYAFGDFVITSIK